MAQRDFSPKFTSTSPPKMTSTKMPQFLQTADTPENQQAFIQAMDEILRRNKGGFTATGSDTSSNVPFRMAGAAPVSQPGLAQPNQTTANPFSPSGSRTYLPELPPQAEEDFTDLGAPSENPTLDEFLTYLESYANQAQQTYGGQPETFTPQGMQSLPDGGYLFSDGRIYYEDGSFRQGDPSATPSMSMPDGSIGYTDGSVRQKYGQNPLYSQPSAPGIEGFMQSLFGGQQAITQAYISGSPAFCPVSAIVLPTC